MSGSRLLCFIHSTAAILASGYPGKIGNLAEQSRNRCQKGETVCPHLRIFCHYHDFIEEPVNRAPQGGYFSKCIQPCAGCDKASGGILDGQDGFVQAAFRIILEQGRIYRRINTVLDNIADPLERDSQRFKIRVSFEFSQSSNTGLYIDQVIKTGCNGGIYRIGCRLMKRARKNSSTSLATCSCGLLSLVANSFSASSISAGNDRR